MIPEEKENNRRQELQQEAAQKLQSLIQGLDPLSEQQVQDIKSLVHRLQIQRIELELQNEQLQASQAELEASREAYKELFDFAPVGYLTLDSDCVIQQANLKAATLLESQRDELIGKNLYHYVLSEDRDRLYLHLIDVLDSRIPKETELRLITKEQTERHVIIQSTPMDSDSKYCCRMVISDISQRIRSEIALREKEKRLEQAQKLGRIGDWYYDVASRSLTWSDTMYTLYERNPQTGPPSLEGLMDYYLPEDAQQLWEKIQAALNQGEAYQIDLRLLRANGELRYITSTGRPLLSKRGDVTRLYGISQDITERKKMEQELRSLNQAKDKFLAIISHDLRNPITSIFMSCDLLLDQIQEEKIEGMKEMVHIIHVLSQRALDLLQNLLNWSRSQMGQMNFEPEELLLSELVQSEIELIQPSALYKNLQIHSELSQDLKLYADSDMLSTILRNLLSNAIKYSIYGGEIFLSVEKKTATKLLFTIRDKGQGIDPAQKEKLFKVEENFSTPGTQQEKGSGLGLILCKEFVEKHGGQIWVESQLGKGATFYFTIPIREK